MRRRLFTKSSRLQGRARRPYTQAHTASRRRVSDVCVRHARPVTRSIFNEVSALSTESIARPSVPSTDVAETCPACGAPLADDQRYCLECGERRAPMSSVLLGGPPSGASSPSTAGATPPAPPGWAPADGATRGSAVTVIAGVGVLLLAMGVGVLIGRSSAPSKSSATPAQVITVTQPGAATSAATTPATTPSATPEASSKGGSPASKNRKGPGPPVRGSEGGRAGGKSSTPATPKSSSPGSGKSCARGKIQEPPERGLHRVIGAMSDGRSR